MSNSSTAPEPAVSAPAASNPEPSADAAVVPPPAPELSLHASLLRALATHPGTRTLTLHTLLSHPHPPTTPALFPYLPTASPTPPTQQTILVTLSSTPPSPSSTPTRVLTSALEANLYTLPYGQLLFISKVDSTGLAAHPGAPSPLRKLIRALIAHFASSATAPLWVHVFARAQGAYLFPASETNGTKRPLEDAALQRWWRATLASLALPDSYPAPKKFYLLPGFSPDEARPILPALPGWIYSHPFLPAQSTALVSPLTGEPISPDTPLAHLIPSFPDDPKSRFLEELASSSEAIDARALKRVKLSSGEDTASKDAERAAAVKALEKVSVEEFWERIGFRQECASGRVTGFFTLVFPVPSPTTIASAPPSAQPLLPPCIIAHLIATLGRHDFSSLASSERATREWEQSVRDLILGASSSSSTSASASVPTSASDFSSAAEATLHLSAAEFDAGVRGEVTTDVPVPARKEGAGAEGAPGAGAVEKPAQILAVKKKKKRAD